MRVRKDYVAIRKVEMETVSPNGLIMTIHDGQEDYNEAIVVAVGFDVIDLSEGDRVYVSQYTGTRVEIPNGAETDNIFFMKEEDILAVID